MQVLYVEGQFCPFKPGDERQDSALGKGLQRGKNNIRLAAKQQAEDQNSW